jgi:hypothetical protein
MMCNKEIAKAVTVSVLSIVAQSGLPKPKKNG